jgi:hypothetical protein
MNKLVALGLMLCVGCSGGKGDPGSAGPSGPSGPAGNSGPMGMTGAMGTMGDPGMTGPSGPQGPSPSPRFVSTVWVSPVGTATDNGAALLAALAGITDASASKPYTLKLEAGTYDIGASTLSAKPFVDIEGSGRLNTTIVGALSSALDGIVDINVTDIEVRDLTVINNDVASGGSGAAVAILPRGDVQPRLTRVDVTVNGKSSSLVYGILNNDRAATVLTDVNATVTSATGQYVAAVYYQGGPSLVSNTPQLHRVTATASCSALTNLCAGVVLSGTLSSFMQEVIATATTSSGTAYGIQIQMESATMDDVIAKASGGTLSCVGIYVDANIGTGNAETVKIRNSLASGNGGSSIRADAFTGNTVTIDVANTELDQAPTKGANGGTNTYACVGDYSSSYAAQTCP